MAFTALTSLQRAAELPNKMLPRPVKSRAVGNLLHRNVHDVIHEMRDGDLLLFEGRKFHSYLIRIATASQFSHAAMIGLRDHEPHVLEVVEGCGGQATPLVDAVEKFEGQWYWVAVNRESYPDFDGVTAAATMWKFVGTPYGKLAVMWEACWHVPGVRVLSYWYCHNDLDRAFVDQAPYCSMAVDLGCHNADFDPAPTVPPQLTTPQTLAQSLLWMPDKTALWPGEVPHAICA